MIRAFLVAVIALAVAVPSTQAQVVPLGGTGENIQPIVRVKIPRPNEVEMAGDWAFVSTDSNGETQGGLYIVNIADPTKPFVQGKWIGDQSGLEDVSFGDVDLSPDGKLAVLTNAHCSCPNSAEGEFPWAVLIDTSDKSKPRLAGQVMDDDTMDYVHTATLDNKTLFLNPQVAAFYPQPGNAHVTMFDISNPAKPVKRGTISGPTSNTGLAHDTYVDHRPDGKTLLYGASIHSSDVFDITDLDAPSWMQSSTSPSYSISHDVQPNHDRTVLVVDDEGAAGGQLDEDVSACGKVGSGPASLDSGSVHFFEAAPDGTFAKGGAVHLGSWNAPTNTNTGACVAHVFWQAPNENRLTQAYYRTGAFVLDFEDPASPKMLGSFVAGGDDGANYWSNKPHRGYLFATDQEGHLDIMKYIGEGGSRWPATAGPAEVQRSARQGVPYVPIAGPSTAPLPGPPAQPSRQTGKFSFAVKAKRVPGKSGKRVKLTLRFTNAAGKTVSRLTVKRKAGRKATIKVSGIAVTGAYKWALTAGKKRVKRGRLMVRSTAGTSLSPGATMAAKAK